MLSYLYHRQILAKIILTKIMDETPYRFEPALIEGDIPETLVALAVDLVSESASLPGRLPPEAAAELADIVRIMNCYYTNLIEGHSTKPVDIEQALRAPREERRPLQQEAFAHVAVQRTLDLMWREGRLPVPTSVRFVKSIHEAFYRAMPPEFLQSNAGGRAVVIVPGAFRSHAGDDVTVGRHQPPSSAVVGGFMAAFEQRYARLEARSAQVLAMPAVHHRLNYIHPFVDGNGRVSRLVSHAMALKAGVGGDGLWSISRGLARGLGDRKEYKRMLDAADQPRRGDRDGRGNLSLAALVDFSGWYLKVALDQIRFCARSFDLEALGQRYRDLASSELGDPRAGKLVERVLGLGEVARGDVLALVGEQERTARSILSRCGKAGYLKSASPKGPVRVAFSVRDRASLFPGLFGDEPTREPLSRETRRGHGGSER